MGNWIKSFFSSSSIRMRFVVWFLVVSLLGVFIIGGISYYYSKSILEESALKEVSLAAQSVEQNIEEFFTGETNELRIFSSNNKFKDYKAENKNQALNELDNLFNITDGYYEVFILDNEGKVILSTSRDRIGDDKSDRDYYLNVIKSNEPYVTDVYESETTGVIGYAIGVPIRGYDEQVNGVVVGRSDLEKIHSFVDMMSLNLGQTGDVYFVDQNMTLMTKPIKLEFDSVLKTKIESDAVKRCLNGEKVVEKGFDYVGEPVLGYYSKEHSYEQMGKNWCVVAEIDLQEVNEPIFELRQQMMLVIFLMMLVISVLALIAGRSIDSHIRRPIKNVSDDLLNSVKQLNSSSQQVTSGSEQIGLTMQQIARNAQSQSKQIEETSQSVIELAKSIKVVGDSIKDVSGLADNISNKVQEGGQIAEQADTKLIGIKDNIGKSVDLVKQLGSKNKRINEITNVIMGIAEQTNLLALNAAIEAARAGEQGRGFAVVAEEIRKLAEESAKSAQDIENVVKEVQSSTAEVVDSMSVNNENITEGSTTISKALDSLKSIPSAVQEISANLEQINAAIEQQTKNTDQIMKNVEQNASAAEEAAAGTEEASAATQQQIAAMQQVAKLVTSLGVLVEDLNKIVSGRKEVVEKHEKSELGENKNNVYEDNSSEVKLPKKKDVKNFLDNADIKLAADIEGNIEKAEKTTKKIIVDPENDGEKK